VAGVRQGSKLYDEAMMKETPAGSIKTPTQANARRFEGAVVPIIRQESYKATMRKQGARGGQEASTRGDVLTSEARM
jgi:hypothetical protein